MAQTGASRGGGLGRGVGPTEGTFTVYCHTHTATGRRYVGVTSGTVAERWRQRVARSRKRSASVFQLAVREFGASAFTCETLETVFGTIDQAQEAERKWVAHYGSDDPGKGWNLDAGGTARNTHPATKEKCAERRRDYLDREAGAPSNFRDRIRGLVRLPGARILPAPLNFRTHGVMQRDAMRGVLGDVGIAQTCVVWCVDDEARERLRSAGPDAFASWFASYAGPFQTIDGHLRVEEIRDGVPCVVLDVDEREAAELLATFDPIGAMAGFDRERYVALAGEFNSTDAAVQGLVADIAQMERKREREARGAPTPSGDTPSGDGEQQARDRSPAADDRERCPHCNRPM